MWKVTISLPTETQTGEVYWFFTKKDLITRRIKELESTKIEIISLELTVSKRKWIIFSVYRPPNTNFETFFSELNICLDKATRTYENIVLLGDINIDTEDEKAKGKTKLSEFCDIFGLENLIKGSTCDTIRYTSTSIDVIINTLSKTTPSTGRGGQFFQLISLLPGNTYQLKELAATSC